MRKQGFPALPEPGVMDTDGEGHSGLALSPPLVVYSRSLSQNNITDLGACKLAEALPLLAASLLRLR